MTKPSISPEFSTTLRLSNHARAKLAEQAAMTGHDIAALLSEIVEQSLTRPLNTDLLAPIWDEVYDTSLADHEIDDFLRDEIEAHRRDKKASRSAS